jgi:flavin-dependent dehydrogenase
MRRNGDMRPLLAHFIEQTTGLREGYRVQGHHIPFGDVRRIPGAGTVLLAGDAAGLVDPITGEGIAFAMESGQRAAQAVAGALQGREAALPHYTRELRGTFQAIAHGRALRHLVFPAPMEKLFLRLLPGSTTLTRLHLDLLAGAVEYPAYTRRVAQRLLPGLLRLVRP